MSFNFSNSTINSTNAPTPAHTPATLVAQVYMSFVIAMTIIWNVLILMAFVRDKRIRTPFNMYILNLTIADLAIACLNMPLFIPYSVFSVYLISPKFCTFFFYVTWLMPAAALAAVMLVALDRLWALYFPIQYRSWRSMKFSLTVCGVMWVYLNAAIIPYLVIERLNYPFNPFTCFSSETFLRKYTFVLQIMLFEAPILTVILSYIMIIVRLATRYSGGRSKIRPLKSTTQGSTRNNISRTGTEITSKVQTGMEGSVNMETQDPQVAQAKIAKEAERTERKLYSALVWIAGFLIVLWTPAGVYFFLMAIYDTYFDFTLYVVVLVLEYSSCAVNPLVYHRSLPDIARAVKALIQAMRQRC